MVKKKVEQKDLCEQWNNEFLYTNEKWFNKRTLIYSSSIIFTNYSQRINADTCTNLFILVLVQ